MRSFDYRVSVSFPPTNISFSMQSEVESWAEPIIDSSTAGNSAIFSARIKREIPDMAEYAGLQPEFVECVDFTPLINPDIDINFSDYNPVHPVCGRRQAKRNGHPDLIEELDSSPQAKRKPNPSSHLIMKQFLPSTSTTEERKSSNQIQFEIEGDDVSHTKLSNIDSSPFPENDLFIYIPNFKRGASNDRLTVRILNKQSRTRISRFVKSIDGNIPNVCSYCGAHKPSTNTDSGRVFPRQVSYELSDSDDGTDGKKRLFKKKRLRGFKVILKCLSLLVHLSVRVSPQMHTYLSCFYLCCPLSIIWLLKLRVT